MADINYLLVAGQNIILTVDDTGVTATIGLDIDQAVDYTVYNPLAVDPAHMEGLFYYSDLDKCFIGLNDEAEVKQCLGREIFARVYNDTGSTLFNGKAVYIAGAFSGKPKVSLAQGNAKNTSQMLGMATHDIETGTYGYITVRGVVNDVPTVGLTEGELAYLDGSTAGEITATEPTGSDFPSVVGTVLVVHATAGSIYINPVSAQMAAEVNNGIGWASFSAQTLTFTDGTRTVSIAPTSSEFVFYQYGIQYRKTSDSYVIPDEEGLYLVYYNLGSLAHIKNPTDAQIQTAIFNNPTVSYVYWNETDQKAEYFGFELHGVESTYGFTKGEHVYHHFADGARLIGNGLAVTNLVLNGSGNTDASAQYGVASGVFVDEDVPHFPGTVASTDGTDLFYFDGATANLRSKAEVGGVSGEGYNVLTDTTAGVDTTGRLVYNDLTGGVYSLQTCGDNTFVWAHGYSRNENGTKKTIHFVGLGNYSDEGAAFDGVDDEQALIAANLPTPEWLRTSSVLFQTRNSYTNEVKARVVPVNAVYDYLDWRKTTIVTPGSSGGSGVPGGSSNDIQVNVAGAFGAYTGFTLDSATGEFSIPERMTLAELSAAPDTPAADYQSLYFLDDGFLYSKNSAGTETPIGRYVERGITASDETTALVVGTGKTTFRIPSAMTVTAVRASVTTAPTGAALVVDINESGTSILSTKISIDAGEDTSETAATPPVISDAALADDAKITIDIDQIGSTVAGTGLKVWLIGTRA